MKYPLDISDPCLAIKRLHEDPDLRQDFFLAPKAVGNMVRNINDLQWLYEQAVELFNKDELSALKLMFHIFFETPHGFGMHHVFDSIGLYMSRAMNTDLCRYIKDYWEMVHHELTPENRAWWDRECAAWKCSLR